ncbi:MAG: hypothetical protein ACSLFP_02240 [Acidimicrobiales bacterium]
MTEAPSPTGTSPSTTRRRRVALGLAAGLLGGVTALAALNGGGPPTPSTVQLAGVTEDISGNCDEAEHAADPECAGVPNDGATSPTPDDSTSSTTEGGPGAANGSDSAPSSDVRAIAAGDAGTVLVAVESGQLRLIAATPAAGWRVEIERSVGREVEATFRSGNLRVDVNVELEDGQVRERVRVRNEADDSETRTENGVVVRVDPPRSDDRSGHGGDDSDDDDDVDDDSDDDSSGHGGDDDSDDDDDSSGHGGDDD